MITALIDHLNDDATYSGLVGRRTYPTVLPQKVTLPAVAYQQISRLPFHDRRAPDSLVRTRYQFSVNGSTYSSVITIMNALKAALQGFTNNNPRVDRVFLEGERDTDQPDIDENYYYRRVIDAIVVHEE